MRVPVSLCAAALIGVATFLSPSQAKAEVTIIINTNEPAYVPPIGRSNVYYGAPYGPNRAYVAPNVPAPAYYGAPAYGQGVDYQPDGPEPYYDRPYGPQPVYAAPYAAPRYYGAPAPVVAYDDRPPPWTPQWYAYCTGKYRSFDPATGTFQPYHGPRQLCR